MYKTREVKHVERTKGKYVKCKKVNNNRYVQIIIKKENVKGKHGNEGTNT